MILVQQDLVALSEQAGPSLPAFLRFRTLSAELDLFGVALGVDAVELTSFHSACMHVFFLPSMGVAGWAGAPNTGR